ncbi:MAG: hypothetical protein ACRC7O_02525, partial [Fimbriiglobus sp.]
MPRLRLLLLSLVASAACFPAAADSEPTVSLILRKASAERWEHDTIFRCEVTLDNSTGHDLAVRSNFYSAFDGLELVVTDINGKVLLQEGYILHQSPYNSTGSTFPIKQGKTAGKVGFPIR